MTRLAYRRDIDGLRAVAVVLVIAYHLGVPGIRGGYLGVDLFFVISGFLIASLFAREPAITRRVLVDFYARRVKRLLPAFVVVAVATTVAAGALMLPADYDAFLKSVRESFLFRSNVYFARETTDYFATDAAELPWLHTWSLAVEWQFYAVFPIVAWLLRRLPSDRARRHATFALVAIGVAVSIRMTAVDAAHAYFSAPARAFEFLTGVLAASWRLPAPAPRTARAVTTLGVVALVGLAMTFDRDTPFPGLAAVAVCALGFATIVFGSGGSILDAAVPAFIGRRSYAAYLWHWPIVALLHYVGVARSAGAMVVVAVVVAVVVLVLADATYRFVERPGIALSWAPPTTFVAWCVAPLLVSAGWYIVVRQHEGFPARLGSEAVHAQANIDRDDPLFLPRCHDDRDPDLERCAFGDAAAPRRALLIGDSHARHFVPFVRVLADAARVRVYVQTDSECLVLATRRPPLPGVLRTACDDAIARDLRLIDSRRFAYVLIAERWIGYPADRLERLDGMLRTIVEAGAVPVLFEPVAEDGTDTKDCFNGHIKRRTAFVEQCAIAVDTPYARVERRRVADLVDAMKARYPSLRVVDPKAVQCDATRCRTVVDDTPIYADRHHLNAYGSALLGREYLARIGNPLASPSAGGEAR